MTTGRPLLAVRGLRTRFVSRYGTVTAVDRLDLSVAEGEVLALVGESGSGKTVTAMSITRLIEPPGRIDAGEILFEGRDLLSLSADEMAELRGERIAMIFQQPKGSLNPVRRIGEQIAEQFVRRRGMRRRHALAMSVELLHQVGIPGAAEKSRAYPHQLSGGQAQRVMTAIALALEPRLLIADEPTTSLDVTVQAQVLQLLTERCRSQNTALILVTHDLGVVAQVADRVAVMYAGRVVEEAPVAQLFAEPAHPYTQGLLNAVPRGAHHSVALLEEVPGPVPHAGLEAAGCAFASRCRQREVAGLQACLANPPPVVALKPGHLSRCWLHEQGGGR